MTRALLLAAVAALVVVAVAAADSSDPKSKISKADQSHATASLLRFSDMGPAWTGGLEKPSSLKIPICPGSQPNNSDLTLTGHAESFVQLKSEGLLIDTDAEVFKTPAQVEKLYTRFATSLLTGCLKYDLLKSVGATGTSVGGVTKLALKDAGAHSSAYRVALKYKGAPVVSDYMFVTQGRTQFFVNVVAPGAVSSQLLALENRIARVLAGRAV